MFPIKIVWYAALVGFITSLAVHIGALLGLGWAPSILVWTLHIGVFVTIAPAFYWAGLDDKSVTIREHYGWLKQVFDSCPPLISYVAILIILYGIANMIQGVSFSFGRAEDTTNGIAKIRNFSAVWLVFYTASVMILYSVMRNRVTDEPQKTKFGADLEICSTVQH
jgi:hypothetical protein